MEAPMKQQPSPSRRATQRAQWNEQRAIARAMCHQPTRAEDLLWKQLRVRKLAGLKCRRQHPIGKFIVDFYCVEIGLAIEVDGGVHAPQREDDTSRQSYLESRDIRFVRFTNDDVERRIGEVLERIVKDGSIDSLP
jgi:very-short-patch-repair endonuclease